jgi:hypothetical protein
MLKTAIRNPIVGIAEKKLAPLGIHSQTFRTIHTDQQIIPKFWNPSPQPSKCRRRQNSKDSLSPVLSFSLLFQGVSP